MGPAPTNVDSVVRGGPLTRRVTGMTVLLMSMFIFALQLPSSIRSGKHCLRTLVALVTLGLADSDSIPMMVRSVLSRP